MPESHLPLSKLAHGMALTITEIQDDPHAAELMHLGFLPGQTVRVHAAGQPLIVDLSQTRIALDRRLASLVLGVAHGDA